MIEIILILGAIAIPLLLLLIAFGGKIMEWLDSWWGETTKDSKSLGEKKFKDGQGP